MMLLVLAVLCGAGSVALVGSHAARARDVRLALALAAGAGTTVVHDDDAPRSQRSNAVTARAARAALALGRAVTPTRSRRASRAPGCCRSASSGSLRRRRRPERAAPCSASFSGSASARRRPPSCSRSSSAGSDSARRSGISRRGARRGARRSAQSSRACSTCSRSRSRQASASTRRSRGSSVDRAGPLVDELALLLGRLSVGSSRPDALRELAERVDAPELTAFVRALVQADRLGLSIARTLRVQAGEVRSRAS